MKAIGIVGSPRKGGNTEILTKHTLKAIEEEGLDTELIRLADLDIRPCNACMVCLDEERCPIQDDLFPIYTNMKRAEAIILASPVYFGSATALLKALMERTGYIARNNGKLFTGKVGGPPGGSAPCRAKLYPGSAHVLVSYPGILHARFNILEHCLWPK